jgi:hypothetical protein
MTMAWFWFDLAVLVGGYGLAIYSWPALRLRLITLRDDPIGTLAKDAASLRDALCAFAGRLRAFVRRKGR